MSWQRKQNWSSYDNLFGKKPIKEAGATFSKVTTVVGLALSVGLPSSFRLLGKSSVVIT